MNIRAPIGRTGYGVVGLNILKEAYKNNNETIYWPIGNPEVYKQHEGDLINKCIDNQKKLRPDWPSLTVWHEFDQGIHPISNHKSGLVFFEKNKLIPKAVNHLQNLDTVFVACKWAQSILDQYGINSSVLPMGVDTDIFRPRPSKPDDVYRFFTVGKIEQRKGHHKLCEWFNKAFTAKDNVALIVNWHNPFLSAEEHKQWEQLYKNTPLGNKILFVNTNTQEEIADIVGQCDCGLFPSASEGFGLNILEAISMNKPVITTNYSAMPDFCTQDHSFLCDYDGLEPAIDGKWFFGEAEWAHRGPIFEEQFIGYMRKAFNEKLNTNPGFEKTTLEYSWSNTYSTLVDHFSNGSSSTN